MLEEFGDQLIVIEPHTSEELAMGWGNDRFLMYQVGDPPYYIPYVRFDGLTNAGGGGSCEGAANNYRPHIQGRLDDLGGLAPVSVEGFWLLGEAGGTETVTAKAGFKLEDPVTLVSPKAFLVVLENECLGTFDHIVRKVHEEFVRLTSVGDSVFIEASWDVDWTNPNSENFECVAFIQKLTGDFEVYQAARLPFRPDFTVQMGVTVASIPEGSGMVEFTGIVTNTSEYEDTFTISLNDTFGGWVAEFMVEGEGGFHATPSVLPILSEQALEVTLRVTTDAEIRFGTGGLDFYSTNSERSEYEDVTVFNGSPAIVAVDDDGSRETTCVYDALDAADLLHVKWDVQHDHDTEAPTIEDLAGYDIVIWYHGISVGGLSEQEEQTLMDFMDTGGGVFLASQEHMSFATYGTFEQDYLGVDTYTSHVQADSSFGVPGDPIAGGLVIDMTYPEPQFFYDKADEVSPNGIATTFLQSEEGNGIGLRADNGTAKCVFMSCALVAMEGEPGQALLIENAVRWLLGLSSDVADDIARSQSTTMRRIIPNPYSITQGPGLASIRMRLSGEASRAPVTLDLLDLNGRVVRNLVQGTLPAGTSTATWDGRDVAGRLVGAGVYFVRFNTIEGEQNQRMVVIK
ncbi:FlgD immunoglobulin-like domain containing protein [Candidatus Eisenbacteria bacterium]|uniref:FlgD immunoglobulin-like domain containing protein n=1 Tax=Eiseniibacteriota bacterium TaxID=2212470 RepID=A0ABV6YL74_UNCEI